MTTHNVMSKCHGGACCGMTHIWNFPISPNVVLVERLRLNSAEWGKFIEDNPAYLMMTNLSYPIQTAGERLYDVIRDIEQGRPSLKESRPDGILEIVLVAYQLAGWKEILAELSFKEVNSRRNSNSGNICHVFHRNSGEKGVKPIPRKAVEAPAPAPAFLANVGPDVTVLEGEAN